MACPQAEVDVAAYKAHLETAHFKKYKATTQDMVKSLTLREAAGCGHQYFLLHCFLTCCGYRFVRPGIPTPFGPPVPMGLRLSARTQRLQGRSLGTAVRWPDSLLSSWSGSRNRRLTEPQ